MDLNKSLLMLSRIASGLLGGIIGLAAIACHPPSAPDTGGAPPPRRITLSAAASLQDVLTPIAVQFQAAYPSIRLESNFGSSGALQQQIEQGAPVDLFLSAATPQMDALEAKDLIHPETRQDVIGNRLVLIAPESSPLAVQTLADLKTAPLKHFSVGEFRSVPAGQYAKQTFERLNLLNSLQTQFVFGNNVRSVLGAVASGHAELGIVYATDALLSDQVKVLLTVPEDLHSAIRYPVAILKKSSEYAASQEFIDFLQTDAVQQIFADFGFVPLSSQP